MTKNAIELIQQDKGQAEASAWRLSRRFERSSTSELRLHGTHLYSDHGDGMIHWTLDGKYFESTAY